MRIAAQRAWIFIGKFLLTPDLSNNILLRFSKARWLAYTDLPARVSRFDSGPKKNRNLFGNESRCSEQQLTKRALPRSVYPRQETLWATTRTGRAQAGLACPPAAPSQRRNPTSASRWTPSIKLKNYTRLTPTTCLNNPPRAPKILASPPQRQQITHLWALTRRSLRSKIVAVCQCSGKQTRRSQQGSHCASEARQIATLIRVGSRG
jgi:hypothetical protein